MTTVIDVGDEYIAAHHGDTMLARGAWYRYVGGSWQVIHPLEVGNELWDIMKVHQVKSNLKPGKSFHAGALDYVKGKLKINDDLVDSEANACLVNMTNGVFKIDEGNLYPHSPIYYMTTQLPFDYDPKATAPTLDYYLETSFVHSKSGKHDHSEAAFVQEAVGLSLTDDTSHEAMFWCFGHGNNGKGILFHILKLLLGTTAIAINLNMLHRDQYQIAGLVGKRAALCAESNMTDKPLEDGLIKMLTSNTDVISARQIYGEPFNFKPKAKLWWSMNHFPVVVDTSNGFFRRLHIIPFNQQFNGNRDLSLKDKLAQELPGIFNWAVEGYRRLLRQGRFTQCAQIAEATRKFQRESNTIQTFVDERCEVQLGYTALATPLYDDYKTWSFTFNYRPLSYRKFRFEMESLGYYVDHRNQGNVYTGLRLKP